MARRKVYLRLDTLFHSLLGFGKDEKGILHDLYRILVLELRDDLKIKDTVSNFKVVTQLMRHSYLVDKILAHFHTTHPCPI